MNNDFLKHSRDSILFCLGTPGCGLRALTGCLRLLGFKSVDEQVESGSQAINALLLQDIGIAPLSAAPLGDGFLESKAADRGRKRIRTLLASRKDTGDPLFLSDSLFCRLLPLWLEVSSEQGIKPDFIHIVRHPYEVALSLQANHGVDLLKSHLVWLTYMRDANIALESYNQTLMTFDQLLSDPLATLDPLLSSHLLSAASPTRDDNVAATKRCSSVVQFIQPNLKSHHAADIPDQDRQNFKPYADLYHQIRMSKYVSGSNSLEIKNFSSSIVDSLVSAIGHCEKKTATHSDPELFTEVVFPLPGKKWGVSETIDLLSDEWQKITFPVPNPELLREKPVMLKPLNIRGTVKISSVTFVHRTTKDILWSAQTPQDFDSLLVNDDLCRVADLESMVLLVVGATPRITISFIKDLPDGPVELVIWLKASMDQKIVHRISNARNKPKEKTSNLVWLSSYPRSGNTLLRMILNHNFGLKSYSIYNDTKDIGKYIEIAELAGHQFMHWPTFLGEEDPPFLAPEKFNLFDPLRYKTHGIKLVKTHAEHHKGFAPDRAIYIYRDGRSSLRSGASYMQHFADQHIELKEIFDQLLCGRDYFFSSWADHVFSWMRHPEDRILFLKFEEVISDFNSALKKIASFLRMNPLRTDNFDFQQLHAINPDFFRKGKEESWQDLFDDPRHALFWIFNHEAMLALGYDNDQHPVCEMLGFNKYETVNVFKNSYFSEERLNSYDKTLQECADLLCQHLGHLTEDKRLLLSRQLKRAHSCFMHYYDIQAPMRETYCWKEKWDDMLSAMASAPTLHIPDEPEQFNR